jgi:hypothetical protein
MPSRWKEMVIVVVLGGDSLREDKMRLVEERDRHQYVDLRLMMMAQAAFRRALKLSSMVCIPQWQDPGMD